MRTFVALDLPESMLDGLEQVQAGLPGRIVARENLHLTLAFLGDVTEPVLRGVVEGLAGLALEAPELRVSGLDVFEGKKPKLAFAAVAPTRELDAVRRAVGRVCRDAGVDLRRERFRPHVTLTRFGREIGRREADSLAMRLGVLAMPVARAARLTLYRSELRPEGPRYDAMALFDFP
jgi:2'-5' RNA ligase